MIQLSLPSVWGSEIEYQPDWLGLRWGAFIIVSWQVALCDNSLHFTALRWFPNKRVTSVTPVTFLTFDRKY